MIQEESNQPQCSALDYCRNVYVASLPLAFDDQQLFDLFAPYGRISSARIMRAKGSHQSKGYGFVMFKDGKSAEGAIEALNGTTLGSTRIQVRLANADASNAFGKAPGYGNMAVSPNPSSANASLPVGLSPLPSYPSQQMPVVYPPVTGGAPVYTQPNGPPITILSTVQPPTYQIAASGHVTNPLLNQPIVSQQMMPSIIQPPPPPPQTTYYMLVDGHVVQGSASNWAT